MTDRGHCAGASPCIAWCGAGLVALVLAVCSGGCALRVRDARGLDRTIGLAAWREDDYGVGVARWQAMVGVCLDVPNGTVAVGWYDVTEGLTDPANPIPGSVFRADPVGATVGRPVRSRFGFGWYRSARPLRTVVIRDVGVGVAATHSLELRRAGIGIVAAERVVGIDSTDNLVIFSIAGDFPRYRCAEVEMGGR